MVDKIQKDLFQTKLFDLAQKSGKTLAFQSEDIGIEYDELHKFYLENENILNKYNTCGYFALNIENTPIEYLWLITLLINPNIRGCTLNKTKNVANLKRQIINTPIEFIITSTIKIDKELTDNFELVENIGTDIFVLRNKNYQNLKLPQTAKWGLQTSGSTGDKKFVLISEDSLYKRALSEIDLFEITPKSNILNILTWTHDLGLNQVLTSLLTGSTLTYFNFLFIEDFRNYLNNRNFDSFTCIPSIWRAFLNNAGENSFNLNIKTITVSGGSLESEEIKTLKNIFLKSKIVLTYGKTETFRTLYGIVNDKNFNLNNNVNGVKFEKKYIGEFTVDGNEVFELIHSGDGLMINEYPTNEIVDKHPSGDLFFEKDSKYFFLGRKDLLKKINGRRFYPQEINLEVSKILKMRSESILLSFNNSDLIITFVESDLEVDQKNLTLQLSMVLEKHLIPYKIITLNKFPQTENGKISYQGLEDYAFKFLFKK